MKNFYEWSMFSVTISVVRSQKHVLRSKGVRFSNVDSEIRE